jgi:alpha-2-macroglobulin
MITRLIAVLFLCGSLQTLVAQNTAMVRFETPLGGVPARAEGAYRLVFRLTTEQAAAFVAEFPKEKRWQSRMGAASSSQLLAQLEAATPVDTLWGSEAPAFDYPLGHYLVVGAKEEGLKLTQLTSQRMQVFIHEHKKRLRLQVLDESGQVVTDAKVFLAGRLLHFNGKDKTYRARARQREGLLEVYRPSTGEALFLDVEPNERDPYQNPGPIRTWYNGAKATKVGFVLLKPVRWVERSIEQFRRGYFSEWSNIRNNRASRRHQLGGYAATNQPKYQPGDTLRVKAWITDRRGRPLKQPMRVRIKDYRGQKTISDTVQPMTPGDYQWTYVLNDSLTLDSRYVVEFNTFKNHKRPSWQPGIWMDFTYEDYELDVVNYTLRWRDALIEPKDTAVLYLSALDVSHQPVPEVSARIVLTATNPEHFQQNDVWVPDTLWQHTLLMPNRIEHELVIPDSIWPACDLQAIAFVYFTNHSGELQKEQTTIQRTYPKLVIEAKDGNLSIQGSPTDTIGILTCTTLNEVVFNDTIRLPYVSPLKHGVQKYTIRTGKDIKTYTNHRYEVLDVRTSHTGDTVIIAVYNPKRINYTYEIRGNQIQPIETGQRQDTFWRWMTTKNTHQHIQMKVSGLANGYHFSQQATATYPRNTLKINIIQPDHVLPGQEVDVRLRVSDAHNKPARGVHMTAGAVNKQFGETTTWSHLYIANDRRFYEEDYTRYDQAELPYHDNLWVPFWHLHRTQQRGNWVRRLGLDSSLYYRLLLYPEVHRGAWVETIGLRDSMQKPEFAPYIIKNGSYEPIHLLYVGGQLSYYSGATPQPYSMQAQVGDNWVRIRTANAEYELIPVTLKSGKKLEIAFSIEALDTLKTIIIPGQPTPTKIKRTPLPDTLTATERKTLQATMIHLRKNSSMIMPRFIGHPDQPVKIIYDMPIQTIGPAYPFDGLYLQVWEFDQKWSQFRFEPGFLYELERARERLYQFNWPPSPTKLTRSVPDRLPGQHAILASALPKAPEVVNEPYFAFVNSAPDAAGLGTLKWDIAPPPDSAWWAAVLVPEADFNAKNFKNKFGPYRSGSFKTNVPPGKYRLILFTKGYQSVHYAVEARRDSLHYIELGMVAPAALVRDTSLLRYLFLPDRPVGQWQQRKASQISYQNAPNLMYSSILTGKVRDVQLDEDLIGANVRIMQNGIFIRGTITDVNGDFRVDLPAGIYDIVTSYTGYNNMELNGVIVREGQLGNINIEMNQNSDVLLGTVEIKQYKVPLILADRVTSGITLTSEQIANLPTRSVNAITGTTAGDITTIRGSRTDAVNYYVDGIRVSGLVQGNDDNLTASPTDAPAEVRQSFRDYAYWKPTLVTDRQGEVAFRVRYPDNITAWDAFAIGRDRKKRAGLAVRTTQVWLPVTAQLALPRFALAGDRFDVAGLVHNRTADSINVRTRFLQDGQVLRTTDKRIGGGWSEYAEVNTPNTPGDSLRIRYELQAPQSTDGEARSIGILPIGTKETEGSFWLIRSDTTVVFTPKTDLNAPVTIHAETDLMHLLLEDLRYLVAYPYGCNEQTASRLRALILADQIVEISQPALRLRMDSLLGTAATRHTYINKALRHLHKHQNDDGSWGWWETSTPNPWMTIYVTRALWEAKAGGYDNESYQKGVTWLQTNRTRLSKAEQREVLDLFGTMGIKTDCREVVQYYDTLSRPSVADRLASLRLHQYCGDTIRRDSLLALMKPSRFGGLYCGEEVRHWYQRRSALTIQAYDLALTMGWTDIAQRIELYWLESRSVHQRTTFETAEIVQRLYTAQRRRKAPEGGTPGISTLQKTAIRINDGPIITQFPLTLNVTPNAPIRISADQADQMLFLTAYQSWHAPQPKPLDAGFEVVSALWQGGKPVENNRLLRGEAAELVVRVKTTTRSQYVMIEVPVPAGCSYGAKPQDRFDGHRAYFRDRVAIFVEVLAPGTHEFRVPLEPRYTGQFSLNPARAEEMYFPTYYGHNSVEKVQIEAEK